MFSLPWWASFAMAMLLTAILGVMIDKGAYLPVRNAPRISALITAIGVSFLIENLGLVCSGAAPKGSTPPTCSTRSTSLPVSCSPPWSSGHPCSPWPSWAVILFIIYRTKTGRAMRCISHDMETTKLMGVDVNRIISHFRHGFGRRGGRRDHVGHALPRDQSADGDHPRAQGIRCGRTGRNRNVTAPCWEGSCWGWRDPARVLMPELAGYRDAIAFGLLS